MRTIDAARLLPMRWPCGPLDGEAARRAGRGADAGILERWAEPAMLDVLAGTPVTCLVLTWADGGPGDDAHQRSLGPLVAEAGRRGLTLVGWAGKDADLRRAAQAAENAGLDAVATPQATPGPPGVLRFRDRDSDDHSRTEFLGMTGALWPGIRVPADGDVDAWSGPTGPVWIDSNAWAVRLARALVEPSALWLAFDPPGDDRAMTAAEYARAIADTAVYGARWIVSLDPALRRGLVDGRDTARKTWAGVARTLAFFEEHRRWATYPAVGVLGVVSAFTGDDAFLAREVLNLLVRQGGLFRILERKSALEVTLEGLEAILYVDADPPDAALRRKLLAFAEGGGTLVTPPGWDGTGPARDDAWLPRFRLFPRGRGRLAVARAPQSDPQRLAEDAQLLMSHRHDPVRLFNTQNAVPHYCTSPDGRSGVLHVVSWSGSLLDMPVTAWFRRPWAEGRRWSVDSAEAAAAERAVVESGVEFHLPPVPVYSALEVSA